SQHLIQAVTQLSDYSICTALTCRMNDACFIQNVIHLTHSNVLPRRNLIPHEILKDDPNFLVQILQPIFAKVDAVQENHALSWVIQASQELDQRRLTLSVFTHEGNSLSRGNL